LVERSKEAAIQDAEVTPRCRVSEGGRERCPRSAVHSFFKEGDSADLCEPHCRIIELRAEIDQWEQAAFYVGQWKELADHVGGEPLCDIARWANAEVESNLARIQSAIAALPSDVKRIR
jgi:hypothetical protein